MEQFEAAFEKSGNPYRDVVMALQLSGCPYLVIGGIAVVLHGSNRFTPDVNLWLDFSSENLPAAIAALRHISLQPEDEAMVNCLADPAARQEYCTSGEFHCRFVDPQLPNFSVDFLLADIGSFSDLYDNCMKVKAYDSTVNVLSLNDLLAVKKSLNRMQDQVDIVQLEFIKRMNTLADPKNSFTELQDHVPSGMDEGFYQSLAAFQDLSPEERFDWLQNMLAAIGGFCMF